MAGSAVSPLIATSIVDFCFSEQFRDLDFLTPDQPNQSPGHQISEHICCFTYMRPNFGALFSAMNNHKSSGYRGISRGILDSIKSKTRAWRRPCADRGKPDVIITESYAWLVNNKYMSAERVDSGNYSRSIHRFSR